jgi:CheY-like chemotaxis protein/anti-sigma regulatory factor (Ser/Thr protein kinase)
MIQMRLSDKALDFIVDDDPHMPRLMIGDMTRIKQIAVNLLTNAVKFTRSGHILFSIEVEKTGADGLCKLKASVRDTGIGIRQEDIPVLFENFSQLDTRRNRGIEGTGLGLAISKNLVGLMDGEIQVESVYGEGTCFSFYVIQRVEDPKPGFEILLHESLRVAVWFSNKEKARVLAKKLGKLEVACDILDSPDGFARYTHAFFDIEQASAVGEIACPDTRLIGVTKNAMDQRALPPNIKIVNTPLTCMVVARLLDETIYDPRDEVVSESALSSLRLHDVDLLVVDDNDINLMIAEETLSHYGARVTTASSGAEAIELVKANDYDIVLMDHMMPEMDGVDATQLIRAMPEEKYQKLPIVALTANVVGDVRSIFLNSGMNDFLSKPLEFAEMERVLKTLLPQDKWSLEEKADVR